MTTKTFMMLGAVSYLLGCGGPSFDGGDLSTVLDAAQDGAAELDTGDAGTDFRADSTSLGDASSTLEGSTEGGAGGDGENDAGDAGDGSTVPTCGDDEIYPQASPTCAKWVAMTQWPLEKGCCRRETHTCGHVVTFSPFCVELH